MSRCQVLVSVHHGRCSKLEIPIVMMRRIRRPWCKQLLLEPELLFENDGDQCVGIGSSDVVCVCGYLSKP